MKSKVEKSEKYNWAIVIDETDLRRLDETIKSTLNSSNEIESIKLNYTIKLLDDSIIRTSDINELVNEHNSKTRSIEYIDISASSKNYSNEINVSLGSRYFQNNVISYSITGDSRDWVYLTASKIEERVKNLKQWYSFLIKLDFLGLETMALFFLLGFVFLQPREEVKKNISLTEYTKVVIILITILSILYLIYKFIKFGCNYFFPKIVFRLGEGIKRHDTVVDLRSKVFWGIFVALLIGVISGLILIKLS